MNKKKWLKVWLFTRKYLLNKYFITSFLFAIVLIFLGDQSLINRVKMYFEERAKKAELREYDKKNAAVREDLRVLEDTESLERLAREKYHMCADGEDVYIIEMEED